MEKETASRPNKTDAPKGITPGAADPAAAEAPVKRALPSLTMDRFGLKESKNSGFWHGAPSDATIEDLLQPSYWANFAGRMRRNSTIEVHWDDSSQFAELYVLDYGRNWVGVALLRHVVLERGAAVPNTDSFAIGYNGAVDLWRIVNTSNRSVLKAGFATETDAHRFLSEHKKKLG